MNRHHNHRRECGEYPAHAGNATHHSQIKSGDCTHIWQASDRPTWHVDRPVPAQRLADVSMTLRDITDLLARGVQRKSDAGARSTRYEISNAA